MNALVSNLKHVARRLQRKIEAGEAPPLAIVGEGESLQRRHCLQAVAVQLGFRNWTHARDVLDRSETVDRGTLMFRETGGAITNIWSASYEQARPIRSETGRFLLPYRRQFVVVEAPFVALLGLDPSDPDWEAIGRDWVEPLDVDAWIWITARRIERVLDAFDDR